MVDELAEALRGLGGGASFIVYKRGDGLWGAMLGYTDKSLPEISATAETPEGAIQSVLAKRIARRGKKAA